MKSGQGLRWMILLLCFIASGAHFLAGGAQAAVHTPAPTPSPSPETGPFSARAAQEAYSAGRFAEAWQTLQAAPDLRSNPYRAYEAGLALYRLGQTGSALAYFATAARGAPRDPDIRHNLGLARSALEQKIGADRLDPASSAWEKAAESLPLGALMSGFGVLVLFLCGAWLKSGSASSARGQLAVSLVLAWAALAAALSMHLGAGVDPPAILTEPAVLRSGPAESYLELSRLEAGVQVRVTGPIAQGPDGLPWRQVRFSDSGVGWVKESGMLLL